MSHAPPKSLILCPVADTTAFKATEPMVRKIVNDNMSGSQVIEYLTKNGVSRVLKKGDFFECEHGELGKDQKTIFLIADHYKGDQINHHEFWAVPISGLESIDRLGTKFQYR